MTPFDVYVILMLDHLLIMASIAAFCGSIATIIFIITALVSDDNVFDSKSYRLFSIPIFVIFIVGWAGVAFIPSTKEAFVIYSLPKIVANKDVQAIPADVMSYVKEFIEEQTASLKLDKKLEQTEGKNER